MFEKSALNDLQNEIDLKPIFTSCRDLDVALSIGGIPIGVITEFCGAPGSGKTQICLQLCVNVQRPTDIGGVDGEAVFIDTNRGYNPYRFQDIADAQSIQCKGIYNTRSPNLSPSSHSLLDKFMNGITLYFVQDYVQLLAVIYTLSEVLAENRRIRLIVIDSFSFLFRQIKNDSEGDVISTRLLYETLNNLQKLADQFSCAIVLTNELTTRLSDTNDSAAYLVPSLGDSHSHRVGRLITLAREDEQSDVFCANIDKSSHSREIVVKFRITKDGIV